MPGETPQKAAELIWQRAEPHFKKMYKVQYYIKIVNDKFDDEFNFFFETVPMSNKAHVWRRSQPLHTLETYDLEYLEKVIGELHNLTNISIRYQGFVGKVWPISGKRIAMEDVSVQEERWQNQQLENN